MCLPSGAPDNRSMDERVVQRPATEPNDGAEATPAPAVTAGSRVDRRRFLRVLGVGALAMIPLPVLPELLRLSSQPKDLTEPTGGHDQAARTRDGRIRQWAMIIDLRSCDGCQSVNEPPRCTAACIEGHFAPAPMEWMETFEAELPGGGTQFIPTPCQQCENPPCVNVCPVGATFSTPEGTVLIDQERCIGCRICMAACPYDRRFFNWGDAPVPPEAMLADYSPEHQVPAQKGTVMKCDFCPDMARAGTLPYCAQGCPNGAIYYGDLEEDVATNGRVIVSVSRFLSENDAYRLKEDMGTKPRVYYIRGHGEAVGRDAFTPDRLPTEWPWMERAAGAATWQR
jgi:molybdopterin-containing oxidoreductase family iron-sulfur binding subunit